MDENVTKGIRRSEYGHWEINELEVSITAKCHLRCANCGFLVPDQPSPSSTHDAVSEISYCLQQLSRLNIQVLSLAVLGGEPTFNAGLLEEALVSFSRFNNIRCLEVVTHGLTPQGISLRALALIDKLTISVYYDNPELSALWERYVQTFSKTTEICFRTDQQWDAWQTKKEVDDLTAQNMFDACWYRRHCATIERGRLFVCSRIPKESRDLEGIILSEMTTIQEVVEYLNQPHFLPACKECTPMMGLPTIDGGKQPDNRIYLLVNKAIEFMQAKINMELA